MKKKLSKDVDCPWCSAKAGEDCYLQLTPEEQEKRPMQTYKIDPSKVHLGRFIKYSNEAVVE